MKYKKLPVLIDAFLLGVDTPPRWFTEAILNGDVICLSGSNFNRGCIIKTLEGEMLARPEMDYIVKGVDGELYPCKADIFEKTYERV